MSRQLTVGQALVGAALLLAVCCAIGATWSRLAPPGPGPDEGPVPVTVHHIQQAGGFFHLTPHQQQWVRDRYLADFQRCLQAAEYRLATARKFGAQRQAAELANIHDLVGQAMTRVGDPDRDPTAEQPLLTDVLAALRKQ